MHTCVNTLSPFAAMAVMPAFFFSWRDAMVCCNEAYKTPTMQR